MLDFRLTYAIGDDVMLEVIQAKDFYEALDISIDKIKAKDIIGFGLVQIKS
jgi:hypothetical protein